MRRGEGRERGVGEFFKQRRHGCLGAMTDGLGCGHLLLCRGGLPCSTMSVLYWFPASLQQHATFRHLCASLLVCTVCACLRARGASGMVHFFSVQAARRDAGTRAKCGVASWLRPGLVTGRTVADGAVRQAAVAVSVRAYVTVVACVRCGCFSRPRVRASCMLLYRFQLLADGGGGHATERSMSLPTQTRPSVLQCITRIDRSRRKDTVEMQSIA